VKFLAKGSHQSLYLTSTGITLLLEGTPTPFSNLRKAGTTSIVSIADRSKPQSTRPTVLRTRLIGIKSDPEISGVGLLPGRVNYLIGRDPKKWRTDIPTFAGVKYQGIYPGVDLILPRE